jgi:hypothetical protein
MKVNRLRYFIAYSFLIYFTVKSVGYRSACDKLTYVGIPVAHGKKKFVLCFAVISG